MNTAAQPEHLPTASDPAVQDLGVVVGFDGSRNAEEALGYGAAVAARRVEVSIDKLRGGKRRPCCFDLSSCTDPELARSGRLKD